MNGVIIGNVKWYKSVYIEEMDTMSVLNDMMYGMGWVLVLFLNTDDVNFIINDICTNY